MSVHTYVEGLRPPDEKWLKMKAVYDACEAADIDPPETVFEFFEEMPPDEKGVPVDLAEDQVWRSWSDRKHGREGIEVDVTKLPKDVTIVRFVQSW